MQAMTEQDPCLDDDEVRTWHGYAHAARRLFAQLDREMQREAGLLSTYWELLGHLAAAPGRRMRMSDLADVTRSAPSRLTHAVGQLECARLVRRRQCTEDRRGCYAELTDEGVEALAGARASAARSLRSHFFGSLSPAELEQLRGISETLLAHLGKECDRPAGRRPR